jgi:hypothetical protein
MIKLEHLLHPMRTARYAHTLITEQSRMRSAISSDRSRIGSDRRYRLQGVIDGFASRLDESDDDTGLLERICAAYIRTTERSESVREEYGATPWWRNIQRHGLHAVRHALAARDIGRLRRMYRNFFRDPCGIGLVTRPPGRAASYFNTNMGDVQMRFILGEALYRIDHWQTATGGRFPLSDLRGPGVGNPFGVLVEGSLVSAGSEYQHYCADRILGLCGGTSNDRADADAVHATVAEIGGGFGGMAYYLLRSQSTITYLDFDLPESLALTAYYLSKAIPRCRMLLYGEAEFDQNALRDYDVILMPPWELDNLPTDSVDLTFSSHALSDLTPAARAEYLQAITRSTRGWLLNIGAKGACESLHAFISTHHSSLLPLLSQKSGWNCYRAPQAEELEQLFRLKK